MVKLPIVNEIKEDFASSSITGAALDSFFSEAFPIQVLPNKMQLHIDELNTVLGYPKDFVAGAFLYALSIAIGNTRVLSFNHKKAKANIFLIVVGRPGIYKSSPFNMALKQIRKIEHNLEKDYKRELAFYEAEHAKPIKERDESIKKPEQINYILDDFTAEALAKELTVNQRGIGVFSDEILGWILNMNKYSGGSSEEMYLSLFNGFPYKVTRSSKEQLTIRNPFLSIGGTIQPEKMKKEFKGKEGNGFTDRVLFIFPKGLKSPKWDFSGATITNKDYFDNIIIDLFSKLDFDQNEYGERIPKSVVPNEKASKILIQWQNSFAAKNDEESEATQSIGAKIEHYLLRFNLILHVLYWITGEEENEFISSERTAENSIILAEYFFNQALDVRNYIYSNDSILSGYNEQQIKFYTELPESFTTATAKQIATSLQIPISTMSLWIKDSRLYKCVKHGNYTKKSLD
ncbi:DUF3987 domain-containing protein [Soonwooa sp.]|uniref:DUF3987 domain-containing protein n=1 Tax=Soonwooa sp. TaxID=1938592 RepID=UPI0028A6626F|nr:DUF3987 domain-containing protein [Soonwooa sp.]